MALELSPCVGLVTPDPGAAAAFFCDAFGMEVVCAEAGIELGAGPFRLFIDPGQSRPLVFELVTTDHQEARHAVRGFGFEEMVWRGPGQSCLVRDPFGLVFNVHQEPAGFEPLELEANDPGFIKPCVGAMLPNPKEAADFYSEVLESPVSRVADGSYILDSGPVRLRFKSGARVSPLVWLRSDAPVQMLELNGCVRGADGALVDPFGLQWFVEPAPEAQTAVVCPL